MNYRRLFFAIALFAASRTQAAPPPDTEAFFEKSVRPLLIAKCQGCHGSAQQSGSVRLDQEQMTVGSRPSPVTPGDPEKSALIQAVRYAGKIKMPPGGKLKAEEIAALETWVKLGAHWPAPRAGATPSGAVTAAQRNFWSFRPVRRSIPPRVKSTRPDFGPIDRFIEAELEKKGLAIGAPASKAVLIRRLSIDLIGMPPTLAEIDRFVADRDPGAYVKLVDRLLADPRYGERWARRWLDVARYADSNGLDENKAMAHAWLYRDYVIAAVNKDKPYNQFILEQLAGDLLPAANPAERSEHLTATGFLILGPKVLAEQDKPKLVMDIVDEQIEVTSKAFLGLTVACARCHNHKFDPIPTRDYYGLAGIFKSTKTMADLGFVSNWNERQIADPTYAARLAAFEPEVARAEAALNAAKQRADAGAKLQIARASSAFLKAAAEILRRGGTGPVPIAEQKPLPAGAQIIEAENYARGNAHKDFEGFGKSIGIIHTTTVPTTAEWDVTVPAGGEYQLDFRYAAKESRPLHILVNHSRLPAEIAGSVTGGWSPEFQRWETAATITLKPGLNTIALDAAADIPHFDKLAIAPARAHGAAPIAEIAASAKLDAAILTQFARAMERDRDPLLHAYRLISDAYARGAGPQAVAAAAADAGTPAAIAAALRGTPPDSEAGISERFGALLVAAQQKSGTLPFGLAQADLKPAEAVLASDSAVVQLPRNIEYLYSATAKAEIAAATKARDEVNKRRPAAPMVMAADEGQPEDVRVHLRGSTLTLGDVAPRHFLTVLPGGGSAQIPPKQSGRLELARWIARPENPLTARVAVNRIWQGHFGTGLVRTPDNWGLLGERPTHPELLDWLASEFTRNGWSQKQLHREIVLSAAFRQASAVTKKAFAADADNRLLARFPRQRMDADALRDSILAVTGRIDPKIGGTQLPTANNDYVTNDQSGNGGEYSGTRRAIYLPVIRNALFDMFQAFDMGDPSMVSAHRATTTVAPQALYLLNSPFVIESARTWAETLLKAQGDDASRVRDAYRAAVGRAPDAKEVQGVLAYIDRFGAHLPGKMDAPTRRLRGWQSFCHVLLASSEFMTIE